MLKRFKTLWGRMFAHLGPDVRCDPRLLAGKAPDSGPDGRCTSAGIHFEALEPRLLLSATGESAAAGAVIPTPQPLAPVTLEAGLFQTSSQDQTSSTNLLQTPQNDQSHPATNQFGSDNQTDSSMTASDPKNAVDAGFENNPVTAASIEPVDIIANADTTVLDAITIRHELVVVDGGIVNYEQLVSDLLFKHEDGRQIEVVVLDPDGEGVAQISDLLAERQDLDALHLVSHGTDRGVKLGDTWIYPENLVDYAGHIATWQASLAERADLLFYGCNFAATEDGRVLLETFGDLTGADVAASADDTGHALLGGDWDLEYQDGVIETAVAFSTDVQAGWAGLLAETVHESYETGTDSLELTTSQSWGQTFIDTDSTGTFTVNRISLWLMENSSANKDLTVSILDSWNGTKLASVTILSDLLADGAFARYDFDFADTSLNYNTTYYLRVDYASSSGKVFVETDSAGTYAGGALLDNGTAIAGDMKFRIVDVSGNNAPTATGVPTDVTVTEDLASDFDLSAVTFADADADPLTVTLTASDGTFAALSGGGVTIGGSGTGTLTLAGTAGDINTYLDTTTNIQYTGANNVSGGNAAAYTLYANDGMVNPQVGSGNIDITAVNDPPALTGDLTATVAEAGTYSIMAADLGYTDVDDVDAGVTFTTSSAVNGKIQVGGVDASTFTGTQLTAGQVTFVHDGSETMAASFDVNVEDGNEDANSPVDSTFNFTVTPVNDPPVLTGDLTATVDEAGTYIIQTSDLWYTDVDDGDAGVTFTTSSVVNGKIQVGGVDASTFTGTQLTAGQVTFVHDGSETVAASFDVNVEDGNEDASAPVDSTFNFTVTPVNDQPTATIGPTGFGVNEDEGFRGLSGFSVGDVDIGGGELAVTLSANNGKINLLNTTGLTFTAGANGTGSMTFTATVADANNAIANNSIQYAGNQHFNGTDTVTLSVDDQGNTGSGGPLSDSDSVNITVSPINDAPTATGAPANITVTEDLASNFDLSTVTFTDIDGDSLTVTLNASSGTFAAGDSGGVTIGGSGTDTLTMTGTAAAINTYLDTVTNIQYTGALNISGDDAASYTLNANDGTVNPQVGSGNIDITAVNDPPALTGDLTATVAEAGTYTILAVDLGYTDADDVDAGVTFTTSSANNGKIQVGGVDASTFTGTQLTAGQVTFVHDGSETVAASFDVNVEDGNEDTTAPVDSTFNFTVTPVNDAPTASNLNTGETYTEGTPLNLTDIVVSDVDSANVTVTLTLSDPAAGTLSTGTSGAVTSTFAGGVWSASGARVDVNTLLVGTAFNPAAGYTSNFTINTSVDDGIAPAVTGTKNVTFNAPPAPEPPPPIVEETTPDPIVPPDPETEPPPAEEPAPEEAEEAPAEADAMGEEDAGDNATAIPPSAAGAAPGQQRDGAGTLRGAPGQRILQSLSLEQVGDSDFREVRERSAANQATSDYTATRSASMALGTRLAELGIQTIRALDFLENSLDGLKQEAENEIAFNQVAASSAIAVTTGLSMGYVAWLLRSGVLLSSLLSSMPAWRFLDPLPVLAGKLDLSEEADEESLETIIEQPSSPAEASPDDTPAAADEKEA